jgi:epsilon-lactone hydrolase
VKLFALMLFLLASAVVQAQQSAADPQPTTAAQVLTRDTSYIDAPDTTHVTRIVPVPKTISAEAQRSAGRCPTKVRRSPWLSAAKARMLIRHAPASNPVRIVTPEGRPETNRDKVLRNLHGGGFNANSGSYTESIPIASHSRIKVAAVLYRVAPEHPFPAAVGDSIAAYKDLLKTCKPGHIVIYGTSAGAILTAQVTARLKQPGLPLPAALGIFSGLGDVSRSGDSLALCGLRGFSGHLDPPEPEPHDPEYAAATDPRDPVLSPTFSDLRGLPPALSTCTAPTITPESMRGW